MRRLAVLPLLALALSASGEEVTYSNPVSPGVQLAGTFVRPPGDQPVATVLLLQGAGRVDRDESTVHQKPLKAISDFLNAQNIATLRADTRGVGASTGNFESATLQDLTSDAVAGLDYLATRRDVDSKRIGIIGHGQGAILGSILAAELPSRVRFLVLLSGTAVSGEKVLLAQTARAQAAAGISEDQINADLRMGYAMYRLAEEGRGAAYMERILRDAPEDWAPFVEAWRRQIPRLQTPWIRTFLPYDPSNALEQVKCPVLALFGSRDMSIDPDQNAAAMKRAFSKGRNHEAKVKMLSGLNYYFAKASTGMPGEYDAAHETIEPTVLQEIAVWITKLL